jgi:hypothetical protein
MAHRLEDFSWDGKNKGRSKYPWNEWTDGNTWEIVQGEDFFTVPPTMVVMLHNRARTMNLKVRTSSYVKRGGQVCIAFQFWNPSRLQTVPKKRLQRG